MRAFILDLDGTLVDSVYQHVIAWHRSLYEHGFELPMWRIHRKIGMSGDLLLSAFALELQTTFDAQTKTALEKTHTREFKRMHATVRPLPGAQMLLGTFDANNVRYAIATSGGREDVDPLLALLQLGTHVPIISKEQADQPKPDPQLFLKAAAALGSRSEETMVIGDSVWDMLAARRAHFLGIGLLTGGYAEHEMTSAGAYRVYGEPQDLRLRLHETGVRIREGT